MCLVSMENLDFRYQPEENDDYVCPDIMVICDRKHLKGGAYSGVSKFIVETLSPLTAKRDLLHHKVNPLRYIIWKMESMFWKIFLKEWIDK